MGLERLRIHHTAELTDVFSFKKLTCTMWDEGWLRSRLHLCGASNALLIGRLCLCQLPGVVFPQLGVTSQNLPDAPFAQSDSNRTMRFLEKNPFYSALNLFPLSPLYFIPCSISCWLQWFNVPAGLWQSQWQNVTEPRSRCPLLKFLSVRFHVAGALATMQLEKFQKWCS